MRRRINNAFKTCGAASLRNKVDKMNFRGLNAAFFFIAAFFANACHAPTQPEIDDPVTDDFVSVVTDYQARGDGSSQWAAHNRAKIQEAINAMGALRDGGTVYFPPGQYNVDDTLYVPSKVRVQGMVSDHLSCQIRLTVTNKPLFKINAGSSGIIFKDLTLYSLNGTPVWPRLDANAAAEIRSENTTGIHLEAGSTGISDIQIENIRIMRFNYGIKATAVSGHNAPITDVKIRNYASDANEYSLHTNTYRAGDWDVQNMNVFPMLDKQNGIFLERSGDRMNFLQLSCAGNVIASDTGSLRPGVCAKLWDSGQTYFRQMHVEGPKEGFLVEYDPQAPSPPINDAVLTVENSATLGKFHRFTNLVSINNRFWIEWELPRFEFFGNGPGSGTASIVKTCGDVWVKWDARTHTTGTVADRSLLPAMYPQLPAAFPNLPASNIRGCQNADLTSAPVFSQGYAVDEKRLEAEVNVTTHCPAPTCDGDDTNAFLKAIEKAIEPGPPESNSRPKGRIFVPAGTYDISRTLEIPSGVTVIGEEGSTISFNCGNNSGPNPSLFKVKTSPDFVRAITFRNLTLTAACPVNTVGIDMEQYSETPGPGGASDFQIQNVDFIGFDKGIWVHPLPGNNAPHPMFDSVSVKDADFTGNNTAINLGSNNASNWNLENIRVNIPAGKEGVRINGGFVSLRDLSCTGSAGDGAACLTIERQSAVSIDELSASGVANALVVLPANGHTQFPVTIRNSNLLAGVDFQGRIYLNSINNLYPGHVIEPTSPKAVRFGDPQASGDIYYGAKSDIFSCSDEFKNATNNTSQDTWVYSGPFLEGSGSLTLCSN